MRNLLAFAAAAALTVAGLGWYLNWYKVRTEPARTGHQNVNIDIDTIKIGDDLHQGVEKGSEKLHRALDKANKHAESAKAETGKIPPSN